MTCEYILQNLEIMCPIIFIDNPGLRDHVMSTLQDSLLIPKPKFKEGDKVRMIEYPKIAYTILHSFYQRGSNRWYYTFIENNAGTPEDKIELVEAAK